MDQDLVVDRARGHRGLRLLHAGDHACERTEATHTAHLRELSAQVVHVELTLGELGRHALGIFLLDRFRRLLDEADDIAHAEDAAGDTLRVEGLDRVRSEARRVGKEWVSTCRSRWSPYL